MAKNRNEDNPSVMADAMTPPLAGEAKAPVVTGDEQDNVTPSPAVEDEQNTAEASPRPTEEEPEAATPQSSDADSSPCRGAVAEGTAFSGTHVVNTARGLNLREAPSYGAHVAEVLPCGTAVENFNAGDAPAGWLHVMTEDGKAGFVAARYVSPVEE